MSLWERWLERFVPELPDRPSRLDAQDGVGRSLSGPPSAAHPSTLEPEHLAKAPSTPALPHHP
jgi:hypothetical protein